MDVIMDHTVWFYVGQLIGTVVSGVLIGCAFWAAFYFSRPGR